MIAPQNAKSPSDYLAAERTFLAWIRTGLALMGFGFVVARFGLFLGELAISTGPGRLRTSGESLWIGTALLIVGVVVNVGATIRHIRLVGKLNRGETIDRPSAGAIVVALSLAALGLSIAIYLIYQ